jgi:hypothetical protein
LGRQFVASRTDASVPEIVARLCGVQAQVTSAAELAVALRSSKPKSDAVVHALNSGTLIKTWAMRGTLHALTADLAAAALSLMASARTWEKPACAPAGVCCSSRWPGRARCVTVQPKAIGSP